MKKLLTLLVVIFSLSLAYAQATNHSVTLKWADVVNPVGTTYNVYKSSGLCSGSPVFNKLATGVTTLTYTDTPVVPGNYCYQVTASLNGMESVPSNSVLAPVPPFAPSALTFAIQ